LNYIVVFDAAEGLVGGRLPFVLGFAVAALAACLIGVLIVRHELPRRARRGSPTWVGVIGLVIALFAVVAGSVIVVTMTALSSVGREETARAIEASPVVEGLVEHFHPMPSGGHDTERFDVAGVHFAYSHRLASQGFNQDVTVGGPIREGIYVRIHYVLLAADPYGTIVRLEIRQ